MNFSLSPELFLHAIVLRANVDFSLLLLDRQIIKANTTAQEGTMTSSLRGLHLHRPRPQLVSVLCPSMDTLGPAGGVWTIPCRATTPPVMCSASPISCPTIRGTLPARSPASQGPYTASLLRCLALVHPLPHCRWMAADTTTTCPTRPRKWTRALCGSFLREWTLLARDLVTEGGDMCRCWGLGLRTGTRISTGLGQRHWITFFFFFFFFFGVFIFIYLFSYLIWWSVFVGKA